MSSDKLCSWDELCPDGAVRFYEGDDPDGFAAEILELFGIDVRAPEPGDDGRPMRWESDREFFVPAGLVESVYGSDRWTLGS